MVKNNVKNAFPYRFSIEKQQRGTAQPSNVGLSLIDRGLGRWSAASSAQAARGHREGREQGASLLARTAGYLSASSPHRRAREL